MYDVTKRDEIVSDFSSTADIMLERVLLYGDIGEEMRASDGEDVKFLINEANKAIYKSLPKEIKLPATSAVVTLSGTDFITVIDLTVRNKHNNSEYKFKRKSRIIYSDNVTTVVHDFMKCIYIELIVDYLLRENIKIINAKLDEIGEAANNTFRVKVVSPMGNEGKKIEYISDDEIVFVADEDRVFSMKDITIFNTPSKDLSEEAIKNSLKAEITNFALAQTTPQFVGIHNPLISYICDLNNRIKPITMIKKVYTRKLEGVRGQKEVIAYYNKDKVFSAVLVSPDGKDVILKPFNVDTLELVDVDVLA